MTPSQFAYIGRWVNKTFPEMSAIALQQMQTKKKFSPRQDIHVLFDVFSDYHNINFPECVKETYSRSITDYKLQFVTLFFCCFEPAVIRGPYFGKVSNHTNQYLSQHIYTNRTMISQYLPKARFYMRAIKEFESDIISMMAFVKVRQPKRVIFNIS